MGYERTAWAGNVILAGLSMFFAWAQVADHIGKWVTSIVAILVVVAALLLFPRKRSDGSAARLIDRFTANVKGDNNWVQIARDNANQKMFRGKNGPGNE